MPEEYNEISNVTLRPAFLVDLHVYQLYSSYIRRILVGLTGSAHTSALVCPSSVNVETILCPAVESIEHPALHLPIFWHQNRRVLLERLSRFNPTLLHAFYPGQVHLAYWLSQQLEVPYVLTLHRPPAKWVRFETPMRHAAGIVAPSEPIVEHLQQSWPGLKDRIERVHVGSFVEDSCLCFSQRSEVAGLIAVHPLDNPAIFMPFLNAIRHLALEGFELMVAIMGKGRKENTIRRQIRALGLTSVVTVVPPMRPVRSILTGADIYVHLEDTGCFDAQLLEAMAVGLAVAGVPEKSSGLLVDGQTASFWDGQDELSIYGCLKKLLGQRAETRQLALSSQAHLRQHNSVSGMVDRLIQTYSNAQQWYKDRHKELDEEPMIVG